MLFPDTWEEFEKHYGFYDSKQAYMFGNTRLIPSFRVQQWLNHLDDINRKKQSQKNKMEQIAKMFGKELGEEFKIKVFTDRVWIAKFTSEGLKNCHKNSEWLMASDYLNDLLTGEAVIIDE
jgi:endo-1,4-beta-D-glucanase Y